MFKTKLRTFGFILLVVALYFFAYIPISQYIIDTINTSQLNGMKLIKIKRDNGCKDFLPVSGCYTEYQYVAHGKKDDVINKVRDGFSNNPNLTIKYYEFNSSVDVNNKSSEVINGIKSNGWISIDFVSGSEVKEWAPGNFIPTDDCKIGSIDCVQARILKTDQ